MIIVTKTKDKILRYSPVRNKPDFYEEEPKTALRDRHKRNLKKWKDTQCFWIGTFSITFMMSVFSVLIRQGSTILTQVPTGLFFFFLSSR